MLFTKKYRMPASTVDYDFTVNVNITDPVAVVSPQVITDTTGLSGVVPPVVVVPPGRKNLIMDNPFNSGTGFSGLNLAPTSPVRITQTTNLAISPQKFVTVLLNKTDAPVPAGSTNRSEMNRPTNAEAFKQNTIRWYGLRYRFPTAFVSDPSCELIFQQHEYSGTASPHFALWTEAGHIWVAVNGVKKFDLGAYPFNTWVSFVIKQLFSSGTNGVIEIWKNDVKVVGSGTANLLTGANIPTTDSYLPYLKLGLYKWQWIKSPGLSTTTTRTILIDQLRIGNDLATYDDVKSDNI